MTTELDFRRALAANPDDADARMVFADWLDEQDRPREACVNRIVAQPDCDRHRLDFAAWLERMKEFTLATYVRSTLVRPDNANVQPASFHESAFRRVTCPTCEGVGDDGGHAWDRSMKNACPDCNGTGDVGGLTWRKWTISDYHPPLGPVVVHWRRGCPERVECRLADVVERYERIVPGAAPIVPDFAYRVTDCARRVCRWHPVLELWPTNFPPVSGLRRRSPSLYRHGWGYTLRELPELVFDSLRDYADVGDGEKVYETDLQAHTALARGLARLARA